MVVHRYPVSPAQADEAYRPTPESLSYSFTLPAAPTSPALARMATRHVLATHGLGDLVDDALLAVSELVTCACRFTEAPDIYLSLRFRADVLRVVVYDSHPRHINSRLSAACDAQRRAHLHLLVCMCRVRRGTWGLGESPEPGGGTRMWASLPRVGGEQVRALNAG
jgi:hypothetical protein